MVVLWANCEFVETLMEKLQYHLSYQHVSFAFRNLSVFLSFTYLFYWYSIFFTLFSALHWKWYRQNYTKEQEHHLSDQHRSAIVELPYCFLNKKTRTLCWRLHSLGREKVFNPHPFTHGKKYQLFPNCLFTNCSHILKDTWGLAFDSYVEMLSLLSLWFHK